MAHISQLWKFLFVVTLGIQNLVVDGQEFEGEICKTGQNSFGECKKISSCDSARLDIQNGGRPQICSYEKNVPIVCCPNPNISWSPGSSGSSPLWPSESGATQQPPQRPPAWPPQQPPQRPTQRPPQRPTQRPVERPTQLPTRSPDVAATQPPTISPSQTPSKRPQWWQIPKRKRTESPPVIGQLMTSPIPGFSSGNGNESKRRK